MGYRKSLFVLTRPIGYLGAFFPELRQGATYKYHIVSRDHDDQVDKRDPFAFFAEVPPKTASIVARSFP